VAFDINDRRTWAWVDDAVSESRANEGYLLNPEDRHSFYQLSNGVPYLHQCPLARSFVILTGLIKVLTSDNESTTSRAFCLHARWRLGSRASRQDQEVTSPAPEETSFCLQTVYLQPTLRAFYQFRSGFQPTRRRKFGLSRVPSSVTWSHRSG